MQHTKGDAMKLYYYEINSGAYTAFVKELFDGSFVAGQRMNHAPDSYNEKPDTPFTDIKDALRFIGYPVDIANQLGIQEIPAPMTKAVAKAKQKETP